MEEFLSLMFHRNGLCHCEQVRYFTCEGFLILVVLELKAKQVKSRKLRDLIQRLLSVDRLEDRDSIQKLILF